MEGSYVIPKRQPHTTDWSPGDEKCENAMQPNNLSSLSLSRFPRSSLSQIF